MAETQQAHGGASDAYFSDGQQQQQQQRYLQQQRQDQERPGYQQKPPDYGQNFDGPGNYPPPVPGNKQTFDQTFAIQKPKWNDLWAGILLILTFCGFIAVSGLSLQGYAASRSNGFLKGGIYGDDQDFGLTTNAVILFAFVLLVALVVSWAYFLMARAFTKQFIWISGILQIVFGIGTSIYYFYRGYYSAAIVTLVFAVFFIICFISWIPRIPFSVLMLQTVMDVARNFGHVFLVSFIGGFIAVAFGAWYSVTLVAVYARYDAGSPNYSSSSSNSSAKVIGLIVFITFAAYWITEWLKSTIHTTVAGVYGSWYFCSQKPGGFPSGSTRGAFRRSITYSFGSISFGSLIVSLIQLLRQAVSIAQSNASGQGNVLGAILFCVLGCFISLLEWAVQFINKYAFSHIALYGKAYLPAAKDTWRMIKDRGFDALINDLLIDPVLTMGSLFVAYLCTLLAYLYLEFTAPAYNAKGQYTPIVLAFSFLIGLQVCNVFLTPLSSGVATLFVAMAWDPQVLVNDFPDLYARMLAVYPHLANAIHA
ncbi:MAG: putative choline transporter, neither null mutation nor overexpression affects choline transport [Trizodia sp. TS-e1964]|nr:MAG: putative choline transporter, neither null mutation nor overexpression affects choline transport [Trizodia sp. TS-e1964]